MKYVLHLSPHVGGGVGAVLMDWLIHASLDVSTKHTLVCLDACHPASLKRLADSKITFLDNIYQRDRGILWAHIAQADIVLMHYWNHPLLARLLVEEGFPSSRLICWCHNSGLHEPSTIPSFLVNLADRIIFTSDVSWHSPNLASAIALSPEKFDSIHSTRDLTPFIELSHHREFPSVGNQLLYAGTVSYDKLHPDTVLILNKFSQLGLKTTILGGPDHKVIAQELTTDVSGILFAGPVDDVIPYLAEADIFIYPLCHNHYGTGEQAILEAMASGLPVVAYNNPPESILIADHETGRLVSSMDEFVAAVQLIADSLDLRRSMAASSVIRVKSYFSIDKVQSDFNAVFDSAILLPKRSRPAAINSMAGDPYLLALALNSFQSLSLLEDIINARSELTRIEIISSYINGRIAEGFSAAWTGNTKGAPRHYMSYFPDSNNVKELVGRLLWP